MVLLGAGWILASFQLAEWKLIKAKNKNRDKARGNIVYKIGAFFTGAWIGV